MPRFHLTAAQLGCTGRQGTYNTYSVQLNAVRELKSSMLFIKELRRDGDS